MNRDGLRVTIAVVLICACVLLYPVHAQQEPTEDPVKRMLDEGRYREAETQARERLRDIEARTGPASVETADALTDVARAVAEMGDPERARALCRRGLEIRRQALGGGHPDVAASLSLLAYTSWRTGEYEESRRLYEQALAIREQSLGMRHPSVATTLGNLAIVHVSVGEIESALDLWQRARSISEASLGPYHPNVAVDTANLAIALKGSGEFARAREMLELSLRIFEKSVGTEHPRVAWVLNALGNLSRESGQVAVARARYELALRILERSLGPDHLMTTVPMLNLGTLLTETGDLVESERLCRRALAARERTLGRTHPDLVPTLSGLAALRLAQGRTSAARSLYVRSLKIVETAEGPNYPGSATSVLGLARVEAARVAPSRARERYESAVRLQERVLGAHHPRLGATLAELAILLARMGDREASREAALRAEGIRRDHTRLVIRSLSSREALRYVAEGAGALDLVLSLAGDGSSPEDADAALDALVRSRSLVFDELALRHRSLAREDDPTIQAMLKRLDRTTRRMASLTIAGPAEESAGNYRHLLEDARRDRESAETALATKAGLLASVAARDEVSLEEVRSSMPSGSALVSYARFESSDEAEPGYLAFVVRAGEGHPLAISLGPADKIDSLVARWSREAAGGLMAPGASAAESERVLRSFGEPLRAAIWDPVAPYVDGAELVLVVPDGSIHRVTLAALPVGDDRYLVESMPTLHYLSTERDVVQVIAGGPDGSGLLTVGAPAFEDETVLVAALTGRGSGDRERATIPIDEAPVRVPGCTDYASLQFDPLPGTAREIRDVERIWSSEGVNEGAVVHLSGSGATETAVRRDAPGKSVLHLSTHGFALETPCLRSFAGDNPLLYAGIALAGANRRNTVRSGSDDGILTAAEVTALDLSSASWVVLSGCDTGTGIQHAGEGVLGLRRAFQIAGVRTVVASLWPAGDEASRVWMERLYRSRFTNAQSTWEAVRSASIETLLDRRRDGLDTHPFHWAGFVAVGDWR